jgi:hypothetical protein
VALQGTIDTFELTDVIKLLASGSKTGRLRLEGARGAGSVWVDEGQIVAIEVEHAPRTAGHAEALFELLRFEDGSFTFSPEESPSGEATPAAVEDILAEAEAQLAEWREIEKVVPTTRATVHLRPELTGADVVLDKKKWRLVAAVGGGATVATVGEALELGELPVSRAVKELVELGVVELSEEPVPEPAPEPAVEVPEPDVVPAAEVTVVDEDSARAQLDEFAAGFGLADPPSDPPAFEQPPAFDPEPAADEPPAFDQAPGFDDLPGFDEPQPTVAEPAPATDGFSDFGMDRPGEPAPFEPVSFDEPITLGEPAAEESPVLVGGGDAAEVARQLSNLSPAAARAVAAAARATTDEEREAALAQVEQEGEEPIDRELLLRFLASVKS